MRHLVLLLIAALLSLPLQAAGELYKCKGENGETVFSDQPCPGGETLPMRETPTYAAPPTPNPLPPLKSQIKKPGDIRYTIAVTQPAADDVIRDNEGNVSIEGTVTPVLFEDHRVRLLLDGTPVESPKMAAAWSLSDVDRGEHSIVIEIVHKDSGKVVGSSPTSKFTLFRTAAGDASPNGAANTNLSVVPTTGGNAQQVNWPRMQDAPQPGDPTVKPPTRPRTGGPHK